MQEIKIEISKEEDRLVISTILVKNGYTVRLAKEKDSTGRRRVHSVVATI